MRPIALMLLVSMLCCGSIARAGTIVVTLTTASGACSTPCTKTYVDTDANLAKIVTAYQAQCNLSIAGTCTSPQVLAWWFDQTISGAIAAVTQFEKSALSNAAISGYTPINPH